MPIHAELVSFHVVNQDGDALEDTVIEQVPETSVLLKNGETAIVDQVDKSFMPKQSIIHVGQQVEFPNSDNIRHHVYSFSEAKTFELKLYADRPESPVRFDQHGVVVLGCNIHDAMVGYIYVAASEDAAMTDKQGNASLSIDNERPLSVWHAHQTAALEEPLIIQPDALERKDGVYRIVVPTAPPPERDTFKSQFR